MALIDKGSVVDRIGITLNGKPVNLEPPKPTPKPAPRAVDRSSRSPYPRPRHNENIINLKV